MGSNKCNVAQCFRWGTRYVDGLTNGQGESTHAVLCSVDATVVREQGEAVALKGRPGKWRLGKEAGSDADSESR